MSAPARSDAVEAADGAVGMPLRLAQRAFAALLERKPSPASDRSAPFDAAKLRAAARRTLASLSADEQPALVRWLALLLAASGDARDDDGSERRQILLRVDPALAANVAASVLHLRREFGKDVDAARAGAAAA